MVGTIIDTLIAVESHNALKRTERLERFYEIKKFKNGRYLVNSIIRVRRNGDVKDIIGSSMSPKRFILSYMRHANDKTIIKDIKPETLEELYKYAMTEEI